MRRAVEFVSAIMGLAWLAATGVLLFFVAGLNSVPWLLLAFVAQDGAFLLCLALLLITNTRRPWGIDPNVRPQAEQRQDTRQPAADPFASDTADMFRDAIMLPDGKPYGRRKGRDDPEVVKRLINVLEQDHPPIPAWAREKQKEAPPDEVVRPSMLDLDLEAATAGLHIPHLDLEDTEGAAV